MEAGREEVENALKADLAFEQARPSNTRLISTQKRVVQAHLVMCTVMVEARS
jgi:hypothetical protein